MGDVGDYWNEARAFKRDARRLWLECPSPGCQFGGNPVKVAPGDKCRHCGWRAPGARGSDSRYARAQERKRFLVEEDATERRWKKDEGRTCAVCGKRLKSSTARQQHERDKHGNASVLAAATNALRRKLAVAAGERENEPGEEEKSR